MSQWVECATKGVKAEKKAWVSAMVLCIFQLPAITRRRVMGASDSENEERDATFGAQGRPLAGCGKSRICHPEPASFAGEGSAVRKKTKEKADSSPRSKTKRGSE